MARNKLNKKSLTGAIVVTVTVVGSVIAGLACTERVPAGYVAGQYSISGGVKQEILTNGWHIVSPTIKTRLYSVATEQLYMSKDTREGSKHDNSFDITCKDGKLNVDFEMSYSFNAEEIPTIMKRYRGLSGEDIVNTVVRGKINTFINEETAKFTVMDAHSEKRGDVNKAIFARLKKELAAYGINVESANIATTRPDKKLAAAIAERAELDQRERSIKAEAEIIKQEAENKRIKAEGEANAKIIAAEAEAKANRIIQQSLTPGVLKQQAIEAWKAGGSKVPQVVGNDTITNLK